MTTLTQRQQDYQHVMVMRNTINALYTAHRISGKPLSELVQAARQGYRHLTCKRVDDGRIPFVDNGIPVTANTSVELPDLELWYKAIQELGLEPNAA